MFKKILLEKNGNVKCVLGFSLLARLFIVWDPPLMGCYLPPSHPNLCYFNYYISHVLLLSFNLLWSIRLFILFRFTISNILCPMNPLSLLTSHPNHINLTSPTSTPNHPTLVVISNLKLSFCYTSHLTLAKTTEGHNWLHKSVETYLIII